MIHPFRTSLFTPLALCVLSLLPLSLRAQTQAIDFVPGDARYDYTNSVASWAVGYQFSTRNADVTLYNLGFYDSGIAPTTAPGNGTITMPDGFTSSHEVGLYDVHGNLLIQTVVSQSATLLDGNFRYAADLRDGAGNPITGPYILPMNSVFYIEGVSHGENYTYVQSGTLKQDIGIAYAHSVYGLSDTLKIPGSQDAAFGYFGPNFTTSSFNPLGTPPGSSTPEPGPSAFALCASVAGLLWRAKRLRGVRPASC